MTQDHTEMLDLIRRHARPLKPAPADMDPVLTRMPGIQAVVFDVYGTLLSSAAGDISLTRLEGANALMLDLLSGRGLAVPDPVKRGSLARRFQALIRDRHQALKGRGIDTPEVEIRDIWRQLLLEAIPDHAGALSASDIEKIAVSYEHRANAVCLNPGFERALAWLRGNGLVMGIVSNAQFYTPLCLQALAGRDLEALGFRTDLLLWSFEHGLGKPGVGLFHRLIARLEAGYRIGPQHALYVGNDMLNDIWPAKQAGMKTVLFAGDQRSLRLRQGDPRCRTLQPDAVVTSLAQLPDLCPAPR